MPHREDRDARGNPAVGEILGRLIKPDMLDTFQTDLLRFFWDAMALWRRAQHSAIEFDAAVQVIKDSDWATFSDS
jgi:hypothetical protein